MKTGHNKYDKIFISHLYCFCGDLLEKKLFSVMKNYFYIPYKTLESIRYEFD